ncbi:MAG: mucoidy inhibitor MuiA family protein [Lachnospiraceae bacterium]|nr:mucoidy inhibitor MuiA family protein [Lachnospiraceae bacterium]MBR3483610.1 mucoidy inhibitor MuiA family protein [Lachnospiraceae bacterium]
MIAKSTVNEVQIYRNSASVIRNGEIELKEGRNIVYIGGMTVTAKQEDFILQFPENIKAVNVQIISRTEVEGDEEKESEALQRKIAEIDYQIETYTLLKELRKTNGNFSGRMDVSVEAQEQYMVALPRQLMDIHKQLTELNDEKDKLQKDYDKALKEEEKPVIMAELVSESAATIPFILRYQEKTGSWSPKYEVRFKSNEEPLEVSMKARIYQNSDEDWKQVKTTLYTGNPAKFQGLPVLDPVQVSIYEEPERRSLAMDGSMAFAGMAMASANAMSASSNGMMAMGMAPMLKMANMQMEEAEISEEETMTAHVLPGLKDILSATNGNIVVLHKFDVKADYHLLSIPRVDNKCFLTAEMLDADWPLPPAYASVYIKDLYAGEIYVDPDSDPSEKFSLSLGQDERLTVVRTELPRKTSEALIKNQKKQIRTYKISLTNKSKETVKVLVKDQIPVSTDKSITVDVNKLSDGSLDVDKGEVKWEISLESGSTTELELGYSISWPKDKKIHEKRAPLTSKPVPPPQINAPGICPTCGNNGGTGKFCVHCGSPMNR